MADYDNLTVGQLVETSAHINGWQKLRRLMMGATRVNDITDGGQLVMKTGTYTGDNNATKAITGVGFQPRMVKIWTNSTTAPAVFLAIKSDQDGLNAMIQGRNGGGGAEVYGTDQIISLDSDGFTVGDGTPVSYNYLNDSSRTYIYAAYR